MSIFLAASFYEILMCAIGAAIILFALVLLAFRSVKSRKQAKKIKTVAVDENYIAEIMAAFGGGENIVSVNIDGIRLKMEVKNLKKVHLPDLKQASSGGVFVTKNTVKVLFKYESDLMKTEIIRRLKGEM